MCKLLALFLARAYVSYQYGMIRLFVRSRTEKEERLRSCLRRKEYFIDNDPYLMFVITGIYTILYPYKTK